MARAQPSSGNAFAGDLLERSAAGYAGFAASLMLDRDPGLRERQGPNALASWRSHLTQRVLELAAAVLAGDSRLFLGRVTWSRKAFRARGQDDQDIRHSIQALRDVLVERLPKPALGLPIEYVDLALKLLASPSPAPDPSELDPKRPSDRLALEYLQKILEGNVADAIVDRHDGGAERARARARPTPTCCCLPSARSAASGTPASSASPRSTW